MIVLTGNTSLILNTRSGASGSEGTWETTCREEEVSADGNTQGSAGSGFVLQCERGRDLNVCSRKPERWRHEHKASLAFGGLGS